MFLVLQSLSPVWLFATPWTVAHQAPLSFTIFWSLLKFMCIAWVMLSNLSYPLLPSSPPALQSFPASGAFPISQFSPSGGQSIGVSASASVLPTNIQDWFPLGWIGWISWKSRGFSRVFSNITVQKHQYSAFYIVQLSHTYMTTGKTIALTRWTFVGKEMSLLFGMLSRLVIAFLPRRKHLLISWL